MKQVTNTVIAFLDNWNSSTTVSIADLYIFYLVTGETFYYSGFQTPLWAPMPNTDSPLNNFILGPRFSRTKTKNQTGPQIDEMDVDIYVSDSDHLGTGTGGSLTWQEALFVGLFDGGYCQLLKAYIDGSGNVIGTLTWFFGRMGDVEVGRTKCTLHVKSLLDMLTIQMPRRLFQSACTFTFGEPMCGYDRVNGRNASGIGTGVGAVLFTCTEGSNQNILGSTFVPTPQTSYDNGTVYGNTGLNRAYGRTIVRMAPGGFGIPSYVYLLKPWIFPVEATLDEFVLVPGCDHTLDTCTNTFNNRERYGGFPFIPPPETAV